jgi:hypothetical protein
VIAWDFSPRYEHDDAPKSRSHDTSPTHGIILIHAATARRRRYDTSRGATACDSLGLQSQVPAPTTPLKSRSDDMRFRDFNPGPLPRTIIDWIRHCPGLDI